MTDDTTPKRPRSVRIGGDWDQGEQLAADLGMSMSDYVRDALARHNVHARRLLTTPTIPAGDLHWDGDTLTAGGEHLAPGVYRIPGSASVVEVTGPITEGDHG